MTEELIKAMNAVAFARDILQHGIPDVPDDMLKLADDLEESVQKLGDKIFTLKGN
jgi:hypothetical protein